MNRRDKARRLFKYIFCVLIFAALIFQCFCLFYLASTYRESQKRKSFPIFPPDTGSFYASIAAPEMNELETVPSSDNTEQPEPSDIPEQSEQSELSDILETSEQPESQDEPAVNLETDVEAALFESDIEIEDEETVILDDEQIQEPDEEYSGQYTEEELLYSILETMKVNQYINTFVLAIAAIILIFKPITQSYIG